MHKVNVRYADVIAEQKRNEFEDIERQMAKLDWWANVRLVVYGLIAGGLFTAWWLGWMRI